MIYRHVDALNHAGFSATVVHHKKGFTCSWFTHETPVTSARLVTLTSNDILVVPEFYGPGLQYLPKGARVIVFNQGAYLTFRGVCLGIPGAPYRTAPAIEAIIAVSKDSVEYLRYAFPEYRIERIRNAVDGRIFHPSNDAPPRRIAMMPRQRAAANSAQLLHILGSRGCLKTWEVRIIDGYSEIETADILRSSMIFVSFSEQEGFGMPVAEAMACGCYVVGFTGFGGRELFDPATSTAIEQGDVLALAKKLECILRADDQELAAIRLQGLTASARILRDYSLTRQQEDLSEFFRNFCKNDLLSFEKKIRHSG